MHWIVALMLLGSAAFAGAVIKDAIETAPEPVREHPALACLREWSCVGPLKVYVTSDGVEYGMYSCEYGVIFLRTPDPQS